MVRFGDYETKEFDHWLTLRSGLKLKFPLKFHKQYKRLNRMGKRLNHFILTDHSVQIPFEIEAKENPSKKIVAIDTGINALASTSTRNQYGKYG